MSGLPSARSSGQETSAKNPVASGAEDPGSAVGSLELRVVNGKTGRPESGVAITAPQFNGLTDERGRFRIRRAGAPPARLWFNVQKPGFVRLQINWDIANPAGPVAIPREYTIELEPGSEIGGIVRDEEGQPIAGASVVVSGGTSDSPRPGGPRIHAMLNHQTKTDAQGRWRCGEVPGRINLSLRITHPDYVVERNSGRVLVHQPDEQTRLRAGDHVTVLRQGATVVGQVRGADGQPARGAEISLAGMHEKPWQADAEGRFRLEHLAPGPNELLVRAPGHIPAARRVAAGGDKGPIDIRLERGRSVSGRVVDHAGKPVAGAMIHFDLGYGDSDRTAPMVATDADGRFRLDGVPEEPGSLAVALQMSRTTRPLSSKEDDVTIVLPMFAAIVRGTVTDADTGRPVPSFAVLMTGCHGGRFSSVDGHYQFKWVNWAWCKEQAVAIQADGYALTEWRDVPDPSGRAEVAIDFQVRKARPVECVVHAPDGSPLPDAEIGPGSLAIDMRFHLQFRIADGHLQPNTNMYAIMRTDQHGRFTLPPFEKSYPVAVAHERGFAVVETGPPRDEHASPVDITLQPWGRVEGTLRIGGRPGAGERISLYRIEPAGMSRHFVSQHPQATTDDQGQFAFDRVLPGMWRVSTRMGQPIPAFRVEPGQVIRLALGGTGRPVVGRLAMPDSIKMISQKRIIGSLSSRLETAGNPEIRSAEGGKRQEEQSLRSISFTFTPQPDGSFRIEDVPSGDYEIGAWCREQLGDDRTYDSRIIGQVRRKIAVPEGPGGNGRSEEPFDIGTLTLEPVLGVGQPAPEFRATTLDGKAIRLSDFRGKHVLVIFWGPQERGGLEESRALRSLGKYRSLTSGERLVILGVCKGASSPDEARAIVSRRGWDWQNAVEDAMPRAEASESLRTRYDLPFRPSVWLIGPDGRILGRDLRGDAIKAAAASVLRAN